MKHGNFLWTEKWRPQTVADCILPKALKEQFQSYVDNKSIPNLLLSGKHGRGKTAVAGALMAEVDSPYIMLNGSLNTNMDALRTTITDWAMVPADNRKFVIIDEADGLLQKVQQALRSFMEEYAEHCGFILTCNYKQLLIPELQSRCVTKDFTIPKEEIVDIIKAEFQRAVSILKAEGVTYEPKVLAEFVKSNYRDFRWIVSELQSYSLKGQIDAGILGSRRPSLEDLLKLLKAKDVSGIAAWVYETEPNDIGLMIELVENWDKYFTKDSIVSLFHLSNEMQNRASRVADRAINLIDYLMQLSQEVTFK